MSGLPPPESPPTAAEAEIIRLLRFATALLQVIAAVLTIFLLVFLTWRVGA